MSWQSGRYFVTTVIRREKREVASTVGSHQQPRTVREAFSEGLPSSQAVNDA